MLMSRLNQSFSLLLVAATIMLSATLFVSCKKEDNSATSQFLGSWRGFGCDEQEEVWTSKTNLVTVGRKQAVAFAQGNDIYVAGGHKKKDFWKYSPSTNTWAQLPDVPGTNFWRKDAVGFCIANKCYVGLGYDIDFAYKRDMQIFDPSTNLWSSSGAAEFPGIGRRGAFCFTIGDTAFIGGGYDPAGLIANDFYAYLPSVNTWYKLNNVPFRVAYSAAFSMDHVGYVVAGAIQTGETASGHRYNRATDSWDAIPDYPGGPRQGMAAYTVGGKGYCGMGLIGSVVQKDMYAYNPANNSWQKVKDFPGTSAVFPVAAAVNGKAYVGTGGDNTQEYTQWYEYAPKTQKSVTFDVTAGPNNFSMYVKYKIGGDTCANEVRLLATVSGNTTKDIFTFNTQNFTDACGNTYAISGSGTLNNENNITISTLVSNHIGIKACTFTGSK
jgi:N-acetylneuraminic acid mutarotase